MLLPQGFSSYAFAYDNWGTNPGSAPGTSITPGASNAEGTYTSIATGSNLSQDIYWLLLTVHGGGTSTAQKDHLLDVGIDPAGGTSYTTVISNIVCGGTYGIQGIPQSFAFPLFIKSGSQVAVRIQGSNATAGTVIVSARFLGQPSNPENVPCGQFTETIGTITNSQGQSFTPGNAADGTWQSLGTTAKAMWWWQLGWQVSNAGTAVERTYIELAHGDGSNKHTILKTMSSSTNAEQNGAFFNGNLSAGCYRYVPAGATLYVRGRCENAPDSGYNAVAIGVGG